MSNAGGTGGLTTVPALLSERAAAQPARVAILLDGVRALTLSGWERRSGAAGHGLLARGVRPGDRVGLLVGGSDWIDYAVGYVAVHRAGGVAVPLSDRLAARQLHERLTHCAAVGLVHGDDATVPPVPGIWTARVADLEAAQPGPVGVPVGVPVGPDDLADIIYTSGTTGGLKGVCARHGNVTFAGRAGARPARPEHVLRAHRIGTVAGQGVLLGALAPGRTVIVAPRFEADRVGVLIESFAVDTLVIVPAMAVDMVNARLHERHDTSSVRRVRLASAPLPPATAGALTRMFPNAEIVNAYSSTESLPASTQTVFDPTRPTSVGRPVDGVEMIVADPASPRPSPPLPPGQTGAVWLRSPAPSRWYHRNPELTARVFVHGWIRMGDLGYVDGDGYLHLVDREDDLVKIGGVGVSTLQVEAALYEHPAVREAAVVGLPHPVLGTAVGAAVVLDEGAAPDDLRGFLRGRLAEHEVPARLLTLASLPRNAGGKVLKREIRELFGRAPQPSGAALATDTEIVLGGLWEEVLGVPVGDADGDFFALGGDSLSANELSLRMEAAFRVEVTPSLVLDLPVLADQAGWIDSRAPWHTAEADPGYRTTRPGAARGRTRAPLTQFQERQFHWARQRSTAPSTRAVRAAVRIREDVDLPALRRALADLAGRHDSLRTVFTPTGGGGYDAFVQPDHEVTLDPIRAEGATPDEREEYARGRVGEFVDERFDIEAGPLFRAVLVRVDDTDHVLAICADHLVTDGISTGVMLRDLGALYSAHRAGRPPSLEPLTGTCSDYTAWVHLQYPKTRGYWERVLDGAPAAAGPLPGQNARPTRIETATSDHHIPADLAVRLRAASTTLGGTLFMFGLTAWVAVLTAWTGAPEIVAITPVQGRTRRGSELLVGSLIQAPYLRVDASTDPTFRELFGRVRDTMVGAAGHQLARHNEFLDRIPFPAHFTLDSWFGSGVLPGVTSAPVPIDAPQPMSQELPAGRTDLSVPRIRLAPLPDGSLRARVTYNTHSFDEPLVTRLLEDFRAVAGRAATDPDLRLSRTRPAPPPV